MRTFSLKRTAASYLLGLVVAFEVLRQVVAVLNWWQDAALRISMTSCRLWQVVAGGKMS